MKNNRNTTKRFHEMIRARHVFIDKKQVFIRKEMQCPAVVEGNVPEWFPTDFEWIPVRL